MAHILIKGDGTPHQGQLRRNIDTLQNWLNDTQRLKGVMDAAKGEANDWTAVATLLGLKDAATAQAVYALFDGVASLVDKKSPITNYITQLG